MAGPELPSTASSWEHYRPVSTCMPLHSHSISHTTTKECSHMSHQLCQLPGASQAPPRPCSPGTAHGCTLSSLTLLPADCLVLGKGLGTCCVCPSLRGPLHGLHLLSQHWLRYHLPLRGSLEPLGWVTILPWAALFSYPLVHSVSW
jgi:hypothetical protein